MKKAEMEQHRDMYESLMLEAEGAERERLFRKSVKIALSAWDHIDGMMQYKRRFDKEEFSNISAIELVLKYAPTLLDFHSLNRLESLLNEQRRIEKNTSESLKQRLEQATALMWNARRLWDHLEQNTETLQSCLQRELGGDQDAWGFIAETWEKMGLLRRKAEGGSYRLALSTRLGEVINGKCPECGALTAAPKAIFFEKVACPKCRSDVFFVIVSETSAD